jgi:hypothetical protein
MGLTFLKPGISLKALLGIGMNQNNKVSRQGKRLFAPTHIHPSTQHRPLKRMSLK